MDENEYNRATVRLRSPWNQRIQNGNAFRLGLTWGAWFALVGGGALLLAGEVSSTDSISYLTPGGLWVLAGGMLLLWAAMAALLVPAVRSDQAALAELRADVNAYEERQSRRRRDLSTTDDDGWGPSKSKRQMQHEWYGSGNSDLNWRDRELGEALGITNGDIYKSNWGDAKVVQAETQVHYSSWSLLVASRTISPLVSTPPTRMMLSVLVRADRPRSDIDAIIRGRAQTTPCPSSTWLHLDAHASTSTLSSQTRDLGKS